METFVPQVLHLMTRPRNSLRNAWRSTALAVRLRNFLILLDGPLDGPAADEPRPLVELPAADEPPPADVDPPPATVDPPPWRSVAGVISSSDPPPAAGKPPPGTASRLS